MDSLAPSEIRYPYAIVRACSELPYIPAFLEMPDGYLRIVLKIVQKINLKNPFSEIFASRQTLARESGKSLDSVHRAIAWLEKQNLIERERVARLGLRGSRSPLVPTQGMLVALGLIDTSGKPIAKQLAHAAPSRHLAKLGEDHLPEHTSTDRPSAAITRVTQSSEHGHSAAKEYARIGTICLPTDLVWLCSRGITPFAVLGLMKLATKAGQRLSDVVKAARKYLENLKSNGLFAYVKKLLGSGRDFSAGTREEEKKEADLREKEYLREKAEIYEGKRFISKKTGKIYQVESGAIRETGGRLSGMAPFTQAFIDAVEEGKLVTYRG